MNPSDQYDFVDDNNTHRIVRITKQQGGDNFSTYVVNVEDVNSGDRFENVAMTRITLRP